MNVPVLSLGAQDKVGTGPRPPLGSPLLPPPTRPRPLAKSSFPKHPSTQACLSQSYTQRKFPEDKEHGKRKENGSKITLRQTENISFWSEKIIRLIGKPERFYSTPLEGLKRPDRLHYFISTSDTLHKAAGKDNS